MYVSPNTVMPKYSFYPRPFWPTGIVIACVCMCVCLYVSTLASPDDNSSHVPARITWFGQKDAKYLALGPYCFGGLIELDRPCQIELLFKILFICITFASLKYLWDVQKWCLLNCSTPHMVPHTFWFLYMHTDRVVPRKMKQSTNISLWDHRSPASPRLGDWQWILRAAVGFRQIIPISYADILYYNICNHRNNCKTASICLYLFVSHTLRSPLFLARLSAHASTRLFHILTSFVRTSPITMLTNRPCHGSWRGLWDSAL